MAFTLPWVAVPDAHLLVGKAATTSARKVGGVAGKRYGLGAILLTIMLSTGLCAALGVLAAHLLH